MNQNEELLNDNPESLAIEADEEVHYDPATTSNVVALEPKIITIGRKKRRDALRNLQDQTS